ncbi:hypothetical protein HG530_005790 [Fusarium avenaceum]|nr:hypothetical protein HG530_005790 [Fusarium avenaceum]
MITIIRLTTSKSTLKKLVHHVAQEEGLSGLATFCLGDMRQGLLLENILRNTDTLFATKTGLISVSTLSDKVESNLSVLNTESFLDTGSKHLQHLTIVSVVANMVENILIGHNTQSSEDDSNGKV